MYMAYGTYETNTYSDQRFTTNLNQKLLMEGSKFEVYLVAQVKV